MKKKRIAGRLAPGVFLVLAILAAWAGSAWADFLTFDCTPAGDAVTGALIQINADAPVVAVLVSECGTDPATKVSCLDPASKTICHPAPAGAFTARAAVSNARDVSAYSAPLNVPAVPGAPAGLKRVR